MPVCIDTEEGIYSHPMGDGLKLMEMGCSGHGGVLTGMALLLAPGGKWNGKRLAVVGDYAEKGDLPEWVEHHEDPTYWYGLSDREEFTSWLKGLVSEAFGVSYEGDKGWCRRTQRADLRRSAYMDTTDDGLYIVNIDKGQYIDPQVFGTGRNLFAIANRQFGPMMALLVLLAVSNNRGGGDLHASDHLIGSWACDRIAIGQPSSGMVDISEQIKAVIIEGEDGYLSEKDFLMGHVPEWASQG